MERTPEEQARRAASWKRYAARAEQHRKNEAAYRAGRLAEKRAVIGGI